MSTRSGLGTNKPFQRYLYAASRINSSARLCEQYSASRLSPSDTSWSGHKFWASDELIKQPKNIKWVTSASTVLITERPTWQPRGNTPTNALNSPQSEGSEPAKRSSLTRRHLVRHHASTQVHSDDHSSAADNLRASTLPRAQIHA